jgi:sulfite exporter TauE/SafE
VIDYGLTFLTGLLSSMHCAGMCGAIVLAYSSQKVAVGGEGSGWQLHVAYNGGRILSYALLGGIVGLAGMALTAVEDIAPYVSIAGGAVMILAGVAMLGIIPLPSTITLAGGSGIRKFYAPLLLGTSARSKLALGMLTPFLPCGVLYAMVVKAATAGSAAQGALTMATFGAGMAPVLMILGSLSTFVSARFRKSAEKFAAITIILMGVILILRGFHVPYLGILAGEKSCPACEGE